MWLLVGLGNPGPGHAKNRHNVGWMAVDEIVRRHRLSRYRSRFHGHLAAGTLLDEKVLALKPATYVNRSGQSVREAARFYRLAAERVIVVHDDLDLAPGRVRVKRGGGSGGHLGLEDIDSRIGNDYLRVRIGIGHPGHKDLVTGYVLHDFSKEEEAWLAKTLPAIAESLPLLLAGNESGFMNQVARHSAPPKEKARHGAPAKGGSRDAGTRKSSAPEDGV